MLASIASYSDATMKVVEVKPCFRAVQTTGNQDPGLLCVGLMMLLDVSPYGALRNRTMTFSAMLPNANISVWRVFILFAV